MNTPRSKYQLDPHYKALVDTMVASIKDCNYTPSEMREAAMLASIIYEENNVRRLVNVENIHHLEEALKTISDFTNASAQST
jgi:hypothetical protein